MKPADIENALKNGGCIKTAYRRPLAHSNLPEPQPQEFILEYSDGTNTNLNGIMFHIFHKQLTCKDKWEMAVGNTLFGGGSWHLQTLDQAANRDTDRKG
ncbi:TPA: cytoplasmic protein [Escherichia coli]